MGKKLMLGNEAVARGAWEAGARFVSSYPGTPSTEITESAAKYDEIYAEWAPNEKVAFEAALGASIAGARSMTCMKHVGLNVAADPLFTASYTGVNAGMVVCVADDPGMHSSQNEQDSRHYAKASKIPMLEPSDSGECKDFAKLAFGFSEEFDTPVILRLSTRVSHSQSVVESEERADVPLCSYIKNVQKYVMMPAMARKRRLAVEERMKKLLAWSETTPLNRAEMNGGGIGVITGGISYRYAVEALGDAVSYLKLGVVYPLPEKLISDFAKKFKTVYVLEELDPVIEEHCKALGLTVHGRDMVPGIGELNSIIIKKAVLGVDPPECAAPDAAVPVRPPVMCAGCPHRGLFYTLKQLGLIVSGDIGCYTLGANPPLDAMDTTICMGASVSGAHGMQKARDAEFAKKIVAVIGDSTFMHSGITGLVDIVYNKGTSTVIILDNSTTGMTGHQDNPTTGRTLKGEPVPQVNLEKLCEAVGVKNVRVVDPFNLKGSMAVIKEETAREEPSVIIARRPCALLKGVAYGAAYGMNEQCRNCKMCMRIGCPAISTGEKGSPQIDPSLCVGCGLCREMCRFGAITR